MAEDWSAAKVALFVETFNLFGRLEIDFLLTLLELGAFLVVPASMEIA